MTTLIDATAMWQPLVVARMPDADEGLVNQEIASAIREFCVQSKAWQEEIGPYSIIPNTILKLDEACTGGTCTGTYPQDLNAEVAFIMEVTIDGTPAIPTTVKRTKFEGASAQGGLRYFYFCPSPRWVQIMPEPETTLTDQCLLRVSMQPTCADNKVPEYFETHYFTEVLDGILGHLYSYPNKPWSDLQAATYHLTRFRRGIARARDISTRRFTQADPEWGFPRTGWV